MTTVYLVVEGQTEQTFVQDVLEPHLMARGVLVRARIIGEPRHKGGRIKYQRARRDIELLMRQFRRHRDVVFSTMFDLYGLSSDFPGRDATTEAMPSHQKVERLEQAFEAAIGDERFFAYFQLHEFEALLFADLSPLGSHYSRHDRADALAADVRGLAPEAIDEHPTTSPAHRIASFFPSYAKEKATVGPLCAHDIGLPRLRAACPHFGAWLGRLEALGR